METVNQDRFKELKATGQLPSPKGVALTILNLIQRDDVTVQEITRVIQTDPALSGRLIKFSNSAYYSARRPVASIAEAVMLIGLPMVRQLVLGFSVLSDFRDGKCSAFDYQKFWSRSLATAIAFQALSARIRASSEETFTCGLLSPIGSLALATLYPEKYAEILKLAAGKPLDELIGLEHERFAIDHNELSAALLRDWGFPAIFTEMVSCHENPDRGNFQEGTRAYNLVHALHLASCLAGICMADESSRRLLLPRLYVLGARLGIDSEALMALNDRIVGEWQEWGRILDVPTQELPPFAEMTSSLPLAPEMAPEQAAGVEFSMRVLVADNDSAVTRSLRNTLTGLGHTVAAAANSKDALRQVVDFNPQVIISDLVGQDADSIAFCKALRASREGRGIYFLMLTAVEEETRLVEAFEAGVDDYIAKPFNPKVLKARLRAGQRVVQLQEELTREQEEVRQVASELAVTNRRLQRMAMTDVLTLLPNRRYGMERLAQEWAASKRNNRPLSCMVIDFDGFKQINDKHGHDVGDSALQQAALILREFSRTQDLIARIGGEEFLAICPDTGMKAALVYAERIRKTFDEISFKVGDGKGRMTVSIGVAERTPAMEHFSTLLKAADLALYQAKLGGRNQVVADGS